MTPEQLTAWLRDQIATGDGWSIQIEAEHLPALAKILERAAQSEMVGDPTTYQEWKSLNCLTSTQVREILAEYGLKYSTRTIQTWNRIGAPPAIDVIARLRNEIINLKWEISRLKVEAAGEEA